MFRSFVIVALTVCLGFTIVEPASAQSSASSGAVLDEIVVTARKREESLQDVSVSVSVTTGEQLLQSGVRGMEELSQSLPAINISKGGASDQLYIRGIGSGFNGGFEQSVGTYIDGVYVGRSRGTRASFVDLARIEVLKGPQTTYFGNSTISGALNLTTQSPDFDEVSGHVTALIEPDHGETNIEGAVNFPLSDKFAVRVAARKYDLDGYVTNTTLGQDVSEVDDTFFRISAAFAPTENFEGVFKYSYGEGDQTAPFLKEVVNCPSTFGTGNPFAPCNIHISSGQPYDNALNYELQGGGDDFTEQEFSQAVLDLSLDSGPVTWTSVTGYVTNEQRELQDLDSGPLLVFNANQYDELEQFSQEIRVSSNGDGNVQWTAGAYYQDGEVVYDVQLAPLFIPPVVGANAADPNTVLANRNAQVQDETTTSVFGTVTWTFADIHRLNIGLRYTEVEKDLGKAVAWGTYSDETLDRASFVQTAAPFPGFATVHSRNETASWDDLLPSISYERDVGDSGMVYASYSAGFKAGGFNMSSRVLGDIEFGEETVDAFELGYKGLLQDGRLRANLALFYSDYEGVQQSVLDPVTFAFSVANAAASSTRGLEADIQWAATDALELHANVTFMTAEFDDFLGACNVFQINNGNCPDGFQDLSGHETTFAPGYSGSVRAIYNIETQGGYRIAIEPNIYFTDSYFIQSDFDPFTEQDSYARVDLRVALTAPSDNWEVALVGRNLTDEEIIFFANDLPGSDGSYVNSLVRPRNIALQGTLRF